MVRRFVKWVLDLFHSDYMLIYKVQDGCYFHQKGTYRGIMLMFVAAVSGILRSVNDPQIVKDLRYSFESIMSDWEKRNNG